MNAKQYIAAAKNLLETETEYDDIFDALCEVARRNLSVKDCDKWHEGEVSRNVNVILHAFSMLNENKEVWINIWGSPEGLEPVGVEVNTKWKI